MSTQPSFYTDSTKEIVLSGTNGKMDKNRFVHPNDRSAMEAFDKIPGADTITRSITTGSAEKFLLAKCYAENIRVNEHQLPEIYKLLEEVSLPPIVIPPLLELSSNRPWEVAVEPAFRSMLPLLVRSVKYPRSGTLMRPPFFTTMVPEELLTLVL